MSKRAPVVACIGECMIELSPSGNGGYRLGFAGDVYNTAVYLKRVCPEAEVRFITVTGDDRQSARMREAWAEEEIDGDFAFTAPGSPGLYLIDIDQAGERSFSYWRSTSPARDWLRRLEAAGGGDYLAGAALVHLSGISLAILAPEERIRALQLLRALRGRVGLISFDPNFRPALWASPEEARQAVVEAAGLADIVLPSEEDTTSLSLVLEGDEIVETRGSLGCRVVHRGHVQTLASLEPVERPVDTSGAGDSFNGAYLAARLRGHDPVSAARAGLAMAARVVQASGAIVKRDLTLPALAGPA